MAGDDLDMGLLIGNLQGTMESLTKSVDNLSATVKDMPCSAHDTAIKELQNCAELVKVNNTEKVKGAISLKNALVIALCTSCLTLAVTLLVKFLGG